MAINSNTMSLLYVVGLFGILYFLMIRPQQQRQKKHQEMIKNLKPDDKIFTVGGLYGTVVKIKEDSVIIKVADNVRMEFQKTAISQVRSTEEGEQGKE